MNFSYLLAPTYNYTPSESPHNLGLYYPSRGTFILEDVLGNVWAFELQERG